jgi:hypothetical protein
MTRTRQISIWKKLHLGKLSLFAALSVADLFMTWKLVHASDGEVYESNPVADAWLATYGWVGLTVYKALAVLLVAMSALYVSLHRPRVGGRLLAFACLATGVVVGYSVCLALAEERSPELAADKSLALDREIAKHRSYQTMLAQLASDLIEQRSSLAEAVAHLETTEKAQNPHWREALQRNHPGRTGSECLAIHVGQHALSMIHHNGALVESVAGRLQRDFVTTFGSPYQFDLSINVR